MGKLRHWELSGLPGLVFLSGSSHKIPALKGCVLPLCRRLSEPAAAAAPALAVPGWSWLPASAPKAVAATVTKFFKAREGPWDAQLCLTFRLYSRAKTFSKC